MSGGARPAEEEAPEIGDAGRAFSADGADGPSRAWRTPPRPSPFGQDVTGRAPIEIGDANTVAVPTRPSERDTQRVVVEETHFLPMMPRPSAGEPVQTIRHGARWRPPPVGSFRKGGSGDRCRPCVIFGAPLGSIPREPLFDNDAPAWARSAQTGGVSEGARPRIRSFCRAVRPNEHAPKASRR